MMRRIELLAPARNRETAFAAIDHGADAVYIGARSFGARAAAGNSTEDIGAVVEYAHKFGAKVYVTINTLLEDNELDEAVALAHDVFGVGVDAVISQDHRLVVGYRRAFPEGGGVFHASTQMDNGDAETVGLRLRQGYEQTVLARELTIDEIADIHRAVPEMPLEVFVHGAVCVCYNGRCFASEVCYGRSANRGECAQFCRMPYSLVTGEGGGTVAEGYLLSMRDMDRTRDLEALLDAGVTSLKIEGRLKDVAYVKNVTAWYRQRLDAVFAVRRGEYCRASWGRERFFFTPDVSRTFNRGYTDYFMHGRTADLCNVVTPKSMGQRVGFVKEIRCGCIVVAGTSVFNNGDGLCFVHEGRLVGFRINRAENNHLYPFRMPAELHDGVVLYRNQDEAMERTLGGRTAERRIPLSWCLEAVADGVEGREGFRLSADVMGRVFAVDFVYAHVGAQRDQGQGIAEVLSKLGGSVYEAVGVDAPGQWFVPRSVLAEWRRVVVARVDEGLRMARGAVPVVKVDAVGRDDGGDLGFDGRTLMHCRYCVRYQTGQCLRDNPGAVRGPLFLRGADGRRFLLRFDCRRCVMDVCLAEDGVGVFN